MMQQVADAEVDARPGLRSSLWVFLSLAGVTAAITMLYLGMRLVMEIGGSCAEGGPFVPVRPCPKGVALIMVGGIWLGLIFAGMYVWQSLKSGGPSFAGLLWPALFLSLGWNFLEFGISPPKGQGTVWGWVICAILFFVMGGLPLGPALLSIGRRLRGGSPPPSWRSAISPAGIHAALGTLSNLRGMARSNTWGQADSGSSSGEAEGALPDTGDLVARLERLDALHRRGSLTDQEYEAAKRSVIASEGGLR
jgi:hypothetical protein